MRQFAKDLQLVTKGENTLLDLTDPVNEVVRESEVRTGQCLVFCTGSTGALTAIEYEPGLLRDFPRALERLVPKAQDYAHNHGGDDNGHSHVRASLLKPDLVVPVRDGRLDLGTWQQVALVELDTRPRERRVAVRVWGE